MDDETIIGFETEVAQQARTATLAARKGWNLEHPIAQSADKANIHDQLITYQDELVLYRSAFVTGAANVSKLLWPIRTAKMPERGPILRAIFGVGHDSVLRSRTLRNALEHRDERLEDHYLVPRDQRDLQGASIGVKTRGNVNRPDPDSFTISLGRLEFDALAVYQALVDMLQFYRGPVGTHVYRMWPQPLEEIYEPILAEEKQKIQGDHLDAQHIAPADPSPSARSG